MDIHQTQKTQMVDAVGAKEVSIIPRPLSVKIIVILMLVSVIGSSIFGFLEGDATYLLGGILFLVIPYGLWNMRRWALYLFTLFVIALLAMSAYEYLTGEIRDLEELLLNSGLPAPLLVLTYLWSNVRKFR